MVIKIGFLPSREYKTGTKRQKVKNTAHLFDNLWLSQVHSKSWSQPLSLPLLRFPVLLVGLFLNVSPSKSSRDLRPRRQGDVQLYTVGGPGTNISPWTFVRFETRKYKKTS